MPKLAYHLFHPVQRTTCVVFASPHSGNDYGDSFMAGTQLDEQSIRSSEDAFVDLLYDQAPQYGAPFIKAGAPRAFIDMNRDKDELDPALIIGVDSSRHNPRVSSGLGVVPRVVSNGRMIYSGKMSLAEAQNRIETFWVPYHQALENQLQLSMARFGCSILVDCHSMPHEALDVVTYEKGQRPDIVLGDRFGASASAAVMDGIEAAFVSAGFTVARNVPFAGAYTVQRYGRPSLNMHAVQVELNRSLYMNERTIQPNQDFDWVKARLTEAIETISILGRPKMSKSQDVAAE